MAEQQAASLRQYDLTPPVTIRPLNEQGINNATFLVQTGAGEFILKRYQSFGDINTLRYEHDLLRWLSKQNLPFGVPTPLAARDGATLTPDGEGWQALYGRLPGQRPAYSPEVIEAVGKALGQLHAALSVYPLTPRHGLATYRWIDKIHPLLPHPLSLTPSAVGLPDEPPQRELFDWWRDMVAYQQQQIEQIYPGLPMQVTHGDFVFSNTLFANGRVTAILDFEMAEPDARLIDIASGLRFILRPEDSSDRWQLVEAFCRGYGSATHLTDHEVEALPCLLLQREIVSSIWWLGRGLAAGNVANQIERITMTQTLVGWLDHYEQQLIDLARCYLR